MSAGVVDVVDRDRDTRAGRPVEAGVLEGVERGGDLDLGVALGEVVDDRAQGLLAHLVVHEGVVGRQGLVEERATQRGLERDRACPPPSPRRASSSSGGTTSSRRIRTLLCSVISPRSKAMIASAGEENARPVARPASSRSVVRKNRPMIMSWVGMVTGTAVGRLEDVVRRQHQDPRLGLGLGGQRQVHRHLVTVEVGVERARRRAGGSGWPCPRSAAARRPGCRGGAAWAHG